MPAHEASVFAFFSFCYLGIQDSLMAMAVRCRMSAEAAVEKNILFSRDFIFSKVSLGSSLQLLERSLRGSFLYGGEPVNQ